MQCVYRELCGMGDEMILLIVGTILLVATVALSGAFLMKASMDTFEPYWGFVPASILTSVVGGAFQLGLGLLLVHLANFLG